MMSSDKWVPKLGDRYWTYGADKKVTSGLWCGDLRFLANWGRVFKTQGQAQAACDEYFGRTTAPPADSAPDGPAVAPAPAPDGWIPWGGGVRPVDRDTDVEVRFCDGDEMRGCAFEFRWSRFDSDGEALTYPIIAYRVCKPEAPVEEPEQKAEGRKDDQGKAPWGLLPFDAVGQIVEVLRFGAQKYSPRNWEAGMEWNRPFDACLRHLTAWWGGEDKDPETRLSHLAHAGCCILFLLAYSRRGVGKDNRPNKMY